MIVTNFAYGTGPYLRTTELTIAFNDELQKRGHARLPVIIPWVYGERQRKIMLEEFGEHDKTYPGELLLDEELGALLKSVFYGDNTYREALEKWVDEEETISKKAHDHLSGMLSVETLSGEKKELNGKDITIELNRSPRIRYSVAPSYFTSFGYIGEILEEAQKVGRKAIDLDPELLERGIAVAHRIEKDQKMHAIAYPATFSGSRDYTPRYCAEVLTPPISSQTLPPPTEPLPAGIFVTITGIPGLERLYKEAKEFGLKLYTTASGVSSVPESIAVGINAIAHPAIAFQFARAGWGSIWASLFSGTPLVVPAFDPTDDPEIYFNNKMVEALGIGSIYHGQGLQEILNEKDAVQKHSQELSDKIMERWGTHDGNTVCASLFVDDFLKNT